MPTAITHAGTPGDSGCGVLVDSWQQGRVVGTGRPPLSYREKPYTSKDARLREEHLNAGQTFARSHS